MVRFVTFGEIMARLQPPGFRRIRQALPGTLLVTFAGSEVNVAASLAYLGNDAAFVTALPASSLAEACIGNLRNLGVDTSKIVRTASGRLGLFFLESGANQRPSRVIYDRERSAVSLADPGCYDWAEIFAGVDWFHISGITPAVSRNAADAALQAVKRAKDAGLTVSCDLNFRKKLWRWEGGTEPKQLARRVMAEIIPYADLVIGNEEDADDVLGIRAGETDVSAGKLEIERYPEVAAKIIETFPNVSRVAVTLRESVSATHNNWGGMLYEAAGGRAFFAPLRDGRYAPYQIHNIVDRVGGGDAFAAALLHALNDSELRIAADAVGFAVAAGCLCHSIEGDFNFSSKEEILALHVGDVSGRVKR
jgi:2-dehydro-3-deoxygluconokinase